MDRASFESELRSAFSGCDDFTVRHTDSGAEVCFLMMGVDRSYVSENLIRPLRLAGATRDTIEVLGVTPYVVNDCPHQIIGVIQYGAYKSTHKILQIIPAMKCIICPNQFLTI